MSKLNAEFYMRMPEYVGFEHGDLYKIYEHTTVMPGQFCLHLPIVRRKGKRASVDMINETTEFTEIEETITVDLPFQSVLIVYN
jgi:hypothetical protein